ncbi:GAF domain-containing protein, partial [Vogesella mureinivorans]|uniref:GAF domain-containing protein n=1 Tax=Vogesella mureinivorans TaxID=657276 RepID=UPI0011C9C2F0
AALTGSKPEQYAALVEQARALLAGEHDRVANAANLSALAFHALPDLNWLGFYFYDGRELVVGPFQGKPACVRIALGRGVCGTAAATGRTQRVDDVDAFPGHIPCDSASRSEVVVPMFKGEQLVGVLDID